MTTTLTGKYTDAEIMLDEDELEDGIVEQVQSMIDHEAFTNPVRVMPDAHPGQGAVIGFTMPLGDKVVPSVVGSDIGCGLTALNIGDELPIEGEELDQKVRDRVPMGWGPDGLKAPNRDYYHIKDNFPWQELNDTLGMFIENQQGAWTDDMREFYDDGGYDIDYFKELISERAGRMSSYFSMNTAINSTGTLGSGNHFIEIGQSENTGDYWIVVHSGSRGVGNNTAKYWQNRASHLRQVEQARDTIRELPDGRFNYVKFDADSVSDEDLLDWLQGAKGETFVDYEALKDDFSDSNPEQIEAIGQQLKTAIPDEDAGDGDPLDFLEGGEASGYLIDMIFCQKYAEESRNVMVNAIADVLGVTPTDHVESPHNMISFRDGIIRKGATEAYENERVIVPLNMADGTLIVEGKSNPEWNHSVNHGAGRVMSRRDADDQFTEQALRNQMADAGAYATAFPTDESPGAYKPRDLIEQSMEPTATICDRLSVVHSFKADGD